MNTIFGTIDAKGEVTENIKLDINSLPSSDPLAFGYGIHKGQWYIKQADNYGRLPNGVKVEHGDKWSNLAPEYIRGFLLGYKGILVQEGTKIRKGQEQNYYWLGEPQEIKWR